MSNFSNFNFVNTENMPVLALRGITVFPGRLVNFDVDRPLSVAALDFASHSDQILFLVAQKDLTVDIPFEKDLYRVGTVCRIKQLLHQPGGKSARVMVEGLARGILSRITMEAPCFFADIIPMPDAQEKRTIRIEALCRRCVAFFKEYVTSTGSVAPEALINILGSDDASTISNFVAQSVSFKPAEKQELLEEVRPSHRLDRLCRLLSRELTVINEEKNLDEATQMAMINNQREFYLREQLKIIRSQLGENGDESDEVEEYRTRIEELEVDDETRKKLLKELKHLSRQPFGSAEASVLRSYLDTCLDVPWGVSTKEVLDIEKARKKLDADHFGLDKVKERILEFLAVRKLAPDVKGGVLCLVGPPGTGKTSIAMSIAHATNRKLCRVALGGVHDEAEIRGHRKTYIGAMPGRIVSGIIQAGSMNPVMVLDEIDKLCSDYRGDPSSALLEALDGEQNCHFRDNFLEVPLDLSDVFFITTANTTESIPRPLLDRMEVIELSSYTDEEKLEIAKRHLLPKQRTKHGLDGRSLRISDGAIRKIITLYTRESGVRILERELASLCRKCASGIVDGEYKSLSVKEEMLESLLGVPKYKPDEVYPKDEIGLVRGLAWTSVGGEVLDVEVGVVKGKGSLELTGNLGDVMKESCKAAITYIRSRAGELGIDPNFYKNTDIHIHFPEGAVPKDGPSAGITICVGVISALTGIPVRRDLAMTGEITLRGRILAVGGLKEKTMAALRIGVTTVIIPEANKPDLEEIDPKVRAALNFITADHMDNILDVALRKSSPADKPKTSRKHGDTLSVPAGNECGIGQ